MKKRSFWRWLLDAFNGRNDWACPHLYWPELSHGRVVGRRCSSCGKYESMAEMHRRRAL